jgi:hypothetical protein
LTGGAADNVDTEIPDAGPEDYHSGHETVFRMWQEYASDWTDADKSGNGDSKLCWAAAAANLIAWGGWAEDEDDVFVIFKDEFKDEPGYIYAALKYYFNSIGLNAIEFTVRETSSQLINDFIISALHDGRGVAIQLKDHYLTIWGYHWFGNEIMFYYTDSSDGGDYMFLGVIDNINYAVSLG